MFESDRVLTLDIGASKVTLAEFLVPKGGGPELVKYGIARFGVEAEGESDTSAYVVAAIRDLMREHAIKPAPLLMTMSGQAVFPRFVRLPPVTKEKLVQIIQYEAEQNVPFPIEEVVWDYQLIGGAEGEMNVMLVAVKVENVKTWTDCVQGAGMEPEVVDVAPMALYNAVRFNYPDIEGCTMVLDVGARSSNLIFLEGTRIFSRSIPVAGNTITQELAKEFDLSFAEAEELKLKQAFVAFGGVYAGPDSEVADRVSKIVRNVITRLHAEVNRSINFYRSQHAGSAPSLVLLTGGSSVIPHLDTFFREKLKVDVDYLNPFVNVAISENLDPDGVASEIQYLGESVGLALRRALTCPMEINLMPPDLVAKKRMRKRQPFFAMAIAGVVLIILCWWMYYQRIRDMMDSQAQMVERLKGTLEGDQGRLRAAQKEKEEAQKRVDALLDVIRRRTEWVAVVDEIHACMLDGMWLKALQPVVRGNQITEIEIQGMWFKDTLEAADKSLEDLSQKRVQPAIRGNRVVAVEALEAGSGSASNVVERAKVTGFELFRNELRKRPLFAPQTEITTVSPLYVSSAREFTVRIALKKPIALR